MPFVMERPLSPILEFRVVTIVRAKVFFDGWFVDVGCDLVKHISLASLQETREM